MNKSKLLDVFRVIPSNELRLFLEYVQSPYFNKREDVILLCSYLIKRAKENFPAHKLKRDYCWAQLFPKQSFNKKEMAYLMSRLCQLAESFLGQQLFEEREQAYPLFALEALTTKRLEKHYQQKVKIIYHNFKKSPLEDSNTIWLQYRVAEIEDFHFNLNNQRQISPFIKQKNEYLDQFFCQKKLQILCASQNIKKILGIELAITWPQSPITLKPSQKHNTVFNAYHVLYYLLSNSIGSESQFLAFKSLLPSLKNKLSPQENIDMISFAINFCLLQFNKGNSNYAKHLLSLYEEGLAQGSLLLNNELSPWIYKNIVKLGLGLKRFEWTEQFILNYSSKLDKEQRKDALHFNLANLNYHQKNYNEALKYLNQVEFTDIYYKYGAKAMLLKIYFEEDEVEAFFALEMSFKILLLRDNKLRSELKATYLNFIRFTAKLFRHKDHNKEKLAKLRAKIEKTPNINGRNWVMAQLNKTEGT